MPCTMSTPADKAGSHTNSGNCSAGGNCGTGDSGSGVGNCYAGGNCGSGAAAKVKETTENKCSSDCSGGIEYAMTDYQTAFEIVSATNFEDIFDLMVFDKSIKWTEKRIRAEIELFKHFFSLLGEGVDGVSFMLVPTNGIDKAWHTCILHSTFYRQLCNDVYGFYVDHIPLLPRMMKYDSLQKANADAFARTKTLFEAKTGLQFVDKKTRGKGMNRKVLT